MCVIEVWMDKIGYAHHGICLIGKEGRKDEEERKEGCCFFFFFFFFFFNFSRLVWSGLVLYILVHAEREKERKEKLRLYGQLGKGSLACLW